jgi:hypothetical protein
MTFIPLLGLQGDLGCLRSTRKRERFVCQCRVLRLEVEVKTLLAIRRGLHFSLAFLLQRVFPSLPFLFGLLSLSVARSCAC